MGRNVAQSPDDSATITFRTYKPASPTVYLPAEFNGWVPNAEISRMTYDSAQGWWEKTLTFKIKDPSDSRRRMGDSVFQYKFNRGGTPEGWYADSLNPEQNPSDHNNSVLRLRRLFWFELYCKISGSQITRITVGLVRANGDTITNIKFSSGTTQSSPLTTIDVTANYDEQKRLLDFPVSPSIPRNNYIRIVAHNNRGDSVVYSQGGYVLTYLPMPSYAKHGVTLPSPASNDSTTFRLRLAAGSYVLIRLAPAGEPVATAPPIVMRHATNPTDWWMNVKLAPGTYEYVYELDGGRQIYDPWGRQNGTFGSRFTIGPHGLTADDYIWSDQNYQRPQLNKLVTYEMNIAEVIGGFHNRTANQPKNFKELIPLLAHYQSLGINALELMPITDYGNVGPSGFSWGYDPNSILSLEPSLGSPADFKELIDSAHGRGIAILLDVVYNHLTEASPLWQMQPDEDANPYFKRCSDRRPNEDDLCFFKDIDHWRSETQEIVYTALKMWIDEYHIDGFRYDYTQGIGWSRSDTTRGILGWANRIRREYGGRIIQIVEHLPESPALIAFSGLTGGWHDSFRDEIFKLAINHNVNLYTPAFEDLVLDLGAYSSNDTPAVPSRYSSRTEPVNATVNHDEQSLIYEMTTFQGRSLVEAIQRDKLYATFMFTSLGIPMLWQGMEYGESRGWLNDGQKLSYRPVQWSLQATERGQSHYNYYRPLIQQRTHNPALYDGNLRRLYRYGPQQVLVWGFEDTVTNSKIMAVANFNSSQQTIVSVPWLGGGTWYNIFDQTQFIAQGSTIDSLRIAGFSALVYSNRSDSSLGIVTTVESREISIPKAFELAQNFPNPFNPTTTIEFQLPLSEHITLKIYDIFGREVQTLVDGFKAPGRHRVDWSAEAAPSGVYFCRLKSTTTTLTRKMLLIR